MSKLCWYTWHIMIWCDKMSSALAEKKIVCHRKKIIHLFTFAFPPGKSETKLGEYSLKAANKMASVVTSVGTNEVDSEQTTFLWRWADAAGREVSQLQNADRFVRQCSRVGVGVVLLFYVLATSRVMSGRVPTCDSAHSWRHYSAAPLGNSCSIIKLLYAV